ncbi:MAG: PepSY domain-containing protein [Myxococcales bacterium]|nr:PepSY domain-containing protein [Myxococcales bacterium]
MKRQTACRRTPARARRPRARASRTAARTKTRAQLDGRSAPRRRRAALRRAHRWIGLALAVPFFPWSITGLLFHLKPGWSAAYDALSPATNAPLPDDTLPLARARAAVPGALSRAELLSTALGPVSRLTRRSASGGGPPRLVDARTGATLSPLPAAQAEQLARAAIASSAHAARYGAVERRALHPDRVELFMDGPGRVVVTIDRHSGALSQRGADTARVDWLYRVHYGQWTGARWLDRVIPLLLLVGVTLLALAGLALFARGARARARPRDADRV